MVGNLGMLCTGGRFCIDVPCWDVSWYQSMSTSEFPRTVNPIEDRVR